MDAREPILSIREATEDDLRFVRASWFESYRLGGFTPQVAFPIYRSGQDRIIERCLRNSRVFVAYATAVPDEVCSWVCVQGELLHYVYTKLIYRRKGIARSLLYKALAERLAGFQPPQYHTHDTRIGRSFTAKFGTKLNPYPLYELPEKQR